MYSIDSVRMVDAKTAEVHLTVVSADGSSTKRTTQFVLENGSWKHELTQAEYDLIAGTTATATATATASSPSHSASASATPNSSPNRNNDVPNLPGNGPAASSSGGDIDCDQVDGPIPTPPGDPDNLDGDGDGLACE
jgi:hypothetical protein